MIGEWHYVSCPIQPGEELPPERKVVLVFVEPSERGPNCLPFCGYVRYAAGDDDSPFFVVYHGNNMISANARAWCDCLPHNAPDLDWIGTIYADGQPNGRGKPARPGAVESHGQA